MNAAEKIARQRLSVLDLAEKLGNVTEACRQRGMVRSQFYEYKQRFAERGFDGLFDLPPIPKSHPFTTPPEIVEKVITVSLAHPKWGCVKVSDLLKLEGVSVSSPTVQNILIKHNLGQRDERMLEVERRHLEEGLVLTGEQVKALERFNPCFRERHVESSRPGELLSADTFTIGTLKGIGRVYMHGVVDTYGSYAFGFLHTSKRPEAAVAVLHNDVLPFYQDRGLNIDAVLTDNGREFCGTDTHPYELYLALNGVEHRRTAVRRPQSNGFVERFNLTVEQEFVEVIFRSKFFESVEALQTAFDEWLRHYNTERPHRGYRNMGRRPIDTVNLFTPDVSQEP